MTDPLLPAGHRPAPPPADPEARVAPPPPSIRSRLRVDRRAVLRWASGTVVFALAYGLALLLLRRYDLQGVAEDAADRAGLWGISLFLVLMAVAVMSPLPDAPVALAGLVAYGPAGGLALVVAGSWLGAMFDFWLVRLLGRERMRRRFPRVVASMDDLAGRLGFELLVVLRILPTVTFDLVSYAAAITRISFTRFAGATFLGQIPGPTIAGLVGAGADGDGWLTAGLTALVLAILGVLLYVRRRIRLGLPQ